MDCLGQFMSQLKSPVYSGDELAALCETYRSEAATESERQAARDQMFLSQIPWAITVAMEFAGQMENEDLAAEAQVAALDAVRSFNPQRGALTTIVTIKVRQRLRRLCFEQRTAIRVPGYLRFPKDAVRHLIKKAAAAHGIASSDFESLPDHDNEDGAEFDCEAYQIATAHLREAMEALPERVRLVIECRSRGQTLKEAGLAIGVTKEAARQLEAKGMWQLKRHFAQLYKGRSAEP